MWSDDANDRRLGKRRSVQMTGWADPGGVSPVVDCWVMDLTEAGARLLAPSGRALPDVFHLRIDKAGVDVDVEVKWRHANQIGVEFMTPVKLAASVQAHFSRRAGSAAAHSDHRL